VAADAQLSALGTIDPYYVYEPRRSGGVLLVKHRTGFGATTASSIRAMVRAIDPSLAFRVIPLEENVSWWRGVSSTVTSLGAGWVCWHSCLHRSASTGLCHSRSAGGIGRLGSGWRLAPLRAMY
jgi:hypothetical protein